MGLFKKFKKENKVENNNELTNEDTTVKLTPNNNEKSELENDLNDLQEQIKEKNERLSTIIEKIELSKKEYN